MSDLDRYLTDEAVEKVRDELAGVTIGGGYYATPIAVDEAEELARMALEVVLPDIIRQAKEEAWDEGHLAGHEDARAVQPTYPQPTRNPYADEHDACCPHPRCPGGGLCCCLPEQGGQP